MSGFSNEDRPIKNTFDSGGFHESTGREPFENANTQGASTGATGVTTGLQGNQGQSGLTRDLRDTHPNDASAGQNLGFAGSNQQYGSNQQSGLNQQSGFNQREQIGDSYGSGASDNSQYRDRTGDLQQDAHRYEGREGAGPRTGGAAGTDRFESSSHGDSYGARDSYPEVDNKGRTSDPGDRNNDGRDERIVGGTMGGSNKPIGEKIKDGLTRHGDDFTKHTGAQGGAYNDTGAKFEKNTSGPGGNANAALTGREGNYRENPVARSDNDNSGVPVRSGVADEHNRSSTTDNNVHGASHDAHSSTHNNDGHKPGLMEKVKEVFHK